MTAPADAFNSGTDLVTLAPAGEPGDELSVSWGIHARCARDSAVAGARAVDQRPHLSYAVAGAPAVGALERHRGDRRAVGEVERRPRRAVGEVDRETSSQASRRVRKPLTTTSALRLGGRPGRGRAPSRTRRTRQPITSRVSRWSR